MGLCFCLFYIIINIYGYSLCIPYIFHIYIYIYIYILIMFHLFSLVCFLICGVNRRQVFIAKRRLYFVFSRLYAFYIFYHKYLWVCLIVSSYFDIYIYIYIYFPNIFHVFSLVCFLICGVKSRSGH